MFVTALHCLCLSRLNMTSRIELAYKLLYAGLSATVPDKIGNKINLNWIATEVYCILVMIHNKQNHWRKFINTGRCKDFEQSDFNLVKIPFKNSIPLMIFCVAAFLCAYKQCIYRSIRLNCWYILGFNLIRGTISIN